MNTYLYREAERNKRARREENSFMGGEGQKNKGKMKLI